MVQSWHYSKHDFKHNSYISRIFVFNVFYLHLVETSVNFILERFDAFMNVKQLLSKLIKYLATLSKLKRGVRSRKFKQL